MTAARCLVVLVSLVTVSLSAPASADLLARNFPAYGERVQFPPGGAGFVDTADPDNTCLALLSSTVTTDDALAFYYNFGRTLVVGAEAAPNAGVNQDLAGTPVDDCFGLANPGSDLVVDDVVVGAGGGVNGFHVLGATEVASLPTVSFGYALCNVSDASTDNDGAPLTAHAVWCGGANNTAFTAFPADRTTPGYSTGTGFLDRDNFAFLHHVVDTLSDDHQVVEFFVSADLFDTTTGTTAAASDRDHVLALTVAGTSTAEALAFASDLNNQPSLATTSSNSTVPPSTSHLAAGTIKLTFTVTRDIVGDFIIKITAFHTAGGRAPGVEIFYSGSDGTAITDTGNGVTDANGELTIKVPGTSDRLHYGAWDGATRAAGGSKRLP